MIRKIIFLIAWIFVSILFVLSLRDFGRSTGAKIDSSIETKIDLAMDSLMEAATTEEAAHKIGQSIYDSYMSSRYIPDKIFQSNETALAIHVVIYVFLSIMFYHFGWIYKRKNE